MKYMSKKDNEIRMEVRLVATHEDEYHLSVNDGSLKWSCPLTALAEFARRIRADEREANANLCEKLDVDYATANRCAFEIRQRGEK
jgi:hypothetical protein